MPSRACLGIIYPVLILQFSSLSSPPSTILCLHFHSQFCLLWVQPSSEFICQPFWDFLFQTTWDRPAASSHPVLWLYPTHSNFRLTHQFSFRPHTLVIPARLPQTFMELSQTMLPQQGIQLDMPMIMVLKYKTLLNLFELNH